jgi:hypothetical protein
MIQFSLLAVFIGCAAPMPAKRTDPVTLYLNTGDSIKGTVLTLDNSTIKYRASSKKKAYEYGEILPVQRIEKIKLSDGQELSVKEFSDFFNDEPGTEVASKPSKAKTRRGASTGDPQFDDLKDKTIAEMTDNEFEYFKMLKESKLEGESGTTSAPATAPAPRLQPQVPVERSSQNATAGSSLSDVAKSLVDAGLAPAYVDFLNKKQQKTTAERQLQDSILRNPAWQDLVSDLDYINASARRALGRAFLYNPEDLRSKLGLRLDSGDSMNYEDLVGQLHTHFGPVPSEIDKELFVDVFGEGGGRSIAAIIENYAAWQHLANKQGSSLSDKSVLF